MGNPRIGLRVVEGELVRVGTAPVTEPGALDVVDHYDGETLHGILRDFWDNNQRILHVRVNDPTDEVDYFLSGGSFAQEEEKSGQE